MYAETKKFETLRFSRYSNEQKRMERHNLSADTYAIVNVFDRTNKK